MKRIRRTLSWHGTLPEAGSSKSGAATPLDTGALRPDRFRRSASDSFGESAGGRRDSSGRSRRCGLLRKTISSLVTAAVLIIAAATAAVTTGCNVSVSVSPFGYVYDASTGNPVPFATVTLTPVDGSFPAATAVSDSNGYYVFSNGIPLSQCELTASKQGYAFIKHVVDFSGSAIVLPNLVGYVPEDSYSVYFLATWDRNFADVDEEMTFPQSAPSTPPTLPSGDFYDYAAASTSGDFAPESDTNGTARGYVSSSSKTYGYIAPATNRPAIQMLGSNSGASGEPSGGPESIILRGIPYSVSGYVPGRVPVSYTATANDPSGLPQGNYYWAGVAEVYLKAVANAYPADSSRTYLATTGSAGGARPVVYVMQGNTQLGLFQLPSYVNVKTAAVARINLLVDTSGTQYFQMLPEVKSVQYERSVTHHNHIIVAKGRPGI